MHQTAPKAKAVLAQALISRHLFGVERFFTRAGDIEPHVGSMRYVGREGYYWSSTASTSASGAYQLHFIYLTTSDFYPSFSTVRWGGVSVRCVAAIITLCLS